MRRAVASWVGLRFVDAAALVVETAEVSAVHPAVFDIRVTELVLLDEAIVVT